MLKDLVSLANHLDAKGLKKEADALDNVVRASLDDAPSYFEDSDLPVASKHKEPALYLIIANRAIGRGEGTAFFELQESVYNNLKAQKLLSNESDSPMGPFTAKDIEVIASVISDSLKKDFRSVIFPELTEDVKKMIGKDLMSIPQKEWSRASMVVGFEIVKYSPELSALRLQGEAERVGTISILGEIQIKDKETYGKEISEYVTHDLPHSYYSELRRIKDEEVYLEPEEHKELLDRFYKKWDIRHDEAKRRALERDFVLEDYPEEEPASEFEVPIGKDIEKIENPEHYNFKGDQGYLKQTENDLMFGRSYRGRYSDKGYGQEDKDYYESYLDRQSSLKIKSDLTKLANHLDAKGLRKEADLLDRLLFKMAEEDSDWDTPETFARDAQSISIGEEMAGMGDAQSMMLEDAVNTGMRTEESKDFMSRWNDLMYDTMSSKRCLEKALSHAEKAEKTVNGAGKLWRAIVYSYEDPEFIWDKEQGRDSQEGIDYSESEMTSKLLSTFKLSGDIQDDTSLLYKLAGYREFFKAVHRRLLDLGPPSVYRPEAFINSVIETTKQALKEERLSR